MILALDTGYDKAFALTAGILFADWNSTKSLQIFQQTTAISADYVPGAFYLRELPGILALLQTIDKKPDYVVIDGYVTLGEDGRPGLGMRLWEEIGKSIPVIGVAKSYYRGTPQHSELLRGDSARPLYVTSTGLSLDIAKKHIASMAGSNRIPTLLKMVDVESRKALELR
jgi:deoxyribonuclease V